MRSGGLQRVLTDLRRRGVTRTAALYAAAAWGLLQVADIVFPMLMLPPWSLQLVLLLAALGFPLVLCLAWFYDFSLEGVRPAGESLPTAVPSSANPLSWWRMVEFGVIALLVVTVGVLYIERFSHERERTMETESSVYPATVGERSLAVLPFENLGDTPEDDQFGEGLAEEILNRLVHMPGLQVASRTSAFQYRGGGDIRQIAEALGVRYVLEGSVRRQGSKVRVTAQFIDAASGYHLWSQNFDRQMQDIFSLQDDIALRVVNSLHLIIDPEARERLQEPPKVDARAYQSYLQARALLRQGADADLLRALELLNQALELDPSFAEAAAGACDARLALYRNSNTAAHFDAAEEHCQRALALKGSAVPVYLALGNLYLSSGENERALQQFEHALNVAPNATAAHIGQGRALDALGRGDAAVLAYRRAIDLAPNEAEAHWRLAGHYFRHGEPERAVAHYGRAADLAPTDAGIINSLGAAYYMLGDYARAAEAWSRSLELEPSALAYFNSATSYYYLGRFEQAVVMYRRALELAPDDYQIWGALGDSYRALDPDSVEAQRHYARAVTLAEELLRIDPGSNRVLALLAHYHAAMGESAASRALMGRALAAGPPDMYVHYDLAVAHALMGEIAAAMEQLALAVDAGYPRDLLTVEPAFAALAVEPAYRELTDAPRAGVEQGPLTRSQ